MVVQCLAKPGDFKIRAELTGLCGVLHVEIIKLERVKTAMLICHRDEDYFKGEYLIIIDIKYLTLKIILGIKFYIIGFYLQNLFILCECGQYC
jgi:hypothetical protein